MIFKLTYSISNGIAIGAIAYVIIRAALGKFTKKDIIVAVIGVLFTRFFLVTI